MSSLLDEWSKREHNPDGTMKPERRRRMQQNGWSEAEINQIEQMHIRDAAIDQEVAQWQQELERQRAEWNAQDQEEMRQRALRLGIPYEEPQLTSINHQFTRQSRTEKMAGLDREELLSQGFLEPDDFYDPRDEAAKETPSIHTRPTWEPPDIEL